jgi:hypothetical protein
MTADTGDPLVTDDDGRQVLGERRPTERPCPRHEPQVAQVSAAERMIEPLDGAGVPELPGHSSAVGSHQVDLRVERTVPPAADGGRLRPGKISGRE